MFQYFTKFNNNMKHNYLVLVCLCCAAFLHAQPRAYFIHVDAADSLYQKGQYAAAAAEYSTAFQQNAWKGFGPDRYNAAKAWSLAGTPDSAFFNLFRLVEKLNYDNLDELTGEKAFEPLYALPRWKELCAATKANQPSMPDLAKELANIQTEDQKYRKMIDSVTEKHGRQSAELQALWDIINTTDSINTQRVTQILDTHGWLGPKAVGAKGNSALFLVVQHADLPIQEKYLPMMREAVKNGNAQGSSLALLEDRILMRNGKKQLYGSQVRSDKETGEKAFFPIEDVDNVDKRRASVGLGPLAEYAKRFGITWDADTIEKNRNAAPK